MKRFSLQFLAIAATLLTVSAKHVEEPLQDICTVTSYADVAAAVKSCTNIVINGITVAAGETLELNLKTGASLTFEGTIKFEYSEWKGPLVRVTGSNVTVKGAYRSVLDGEG